METLRDQGVWLNMLSKVPVTSDRILYAVEDKLTSFIGMAISNNRIQFIID